MIENTQDNALPEFEYKYLEKVRGFLCHLAMTYSIIFPFLKGFHLTLLSHLPRRDEEGWKIATVHTVAKAKADKHSADYCYHDYPKTVKPVPRLKGDMNALMMITKAEKPPVIIKNSPRLYIVKYGFGDASGGGFGTTLEEKEGIKVFAGTWNERGNKKSSNFRELSNLVLRLEAEATLGNLEGAELFFFTDNEAAQNCYHNGTSTSKLLFELVVRLRKLELNVGLRLHIIHVSGKRMIEQGTDGVSRGNMMEGVLAGRKMLSFIPIHLTALERNGRVLEWIRTWSGNDKLEPLKPLDWMIRGQGIGRKTWKNCDEAVFPVRSKERVFLWAPPPCIGDVAIEMLRESVHRRPDAVHIIVIPKLMTYVWRKMLLRSCDMSFYVDTGHSFWPEGMCESLMFGIYLPLLPCFPWTLRRSGSVLEMERLLSKLSKGEEGAKGTLLRQFLLFTGRLSTMPECLVRKLLRQKRCR